METVISFIIIFGALVFFHELGHFLFAKRAGILVREFAIGMGPKILGITKGETLYTVRLLPIGGYVRMAGEDFDRVVLQAGHRIGVLLNEDGQAKKIILNQKTMYPDIMFLEVEEADLEKELYIKGYDEEERFVRLDVAREAVIEENGTETVLAPHDRQFDSKSIGHRFMTIFAGPLFNFILAFFIFTAIGPLQGVPTNEPVIAEVADDSPAQEAGMQAGDMITEVDGKTITTWNQLVESVQDEAGNPLDFKVQRDGEPVEFTITPELLEQEQGDIGVIGVLYDSPREKDFFGSFVYGAETTVFWFKEIFRLLGMLVTGQFTIDALSGPVGIYKTTEQVAQYGIFTLMSLAGMLYISLGILHILPRPARAGVRLMFFDHEALRGKPVDQRKEGMVHFVGIMLLMLLMIVVTWNDIQKLFF